jgi:sucrose-6-phosphate hydrolase SacC (GH32 family)
VEVFGNDGGAVLTSCFLPSDTDRSLAIETKGANAKVVSSAVYPLKSVWH